MRIDPQSLRKKGRVPKDGSVFFTIFQTFMTGSNAGADADGNPSHNFGNYPPDVFDLVIVDECHWGGAYDESAWRGILEYFAPAVQLGLSATPKRKLNADTHLYFGDPVYTYSLKGGINNGFLTPFKVRQIQSMQATKFWSPDGKPMSAVEFITKHLGELPEMFQSEDQLRELGGDPDTRRKLMQGLEECGYLDAQLVEIAKVVHAEKSDVFDVLAYVAYAKPTKTRAERVADHRDEIQASCTEKRRVFLNFVLDQYVDQGVGELNANKLPQLLDLGYHAVADAVRELGTIDGIRALFVGSQRCLYRQRRAG